MLVTPDLCVSVRRPWYTGVMDTQIHLRPVKETSIEPTLTAFAKLRQVLHDNGIQLNGIDLEFNCPPRTPEYPNASAYFIVGVFVPVPESSDTNVS